MDDKVKVEAEISQANFEALKDLAQKRGLDANTVLQQAIATEKLISDNVGPDDELLIKRGDRFSKVLFSKE
jgi:hypothetical protein